LARKILLADDSVTAQNMGRKILADAGYDVVTVNNGSAALKRITELKPDLIVLDVYMPGYSGLEVCQKLKDSEETAHIPVLLTVGKLEPFKPEEARRVRADGHIVKPFEASELLTVITRLEDRMVKQQRDGARGGGAGSGPERFGSEGNGRKVEGNSVTDSGWKSRLGFPSKKKKEEKEEIEESEGAAAGTFRDFRKGKRKAGTGDVSSAQRPSGPEAVPDIPRDITPEELDALSALAAKLDRPVEKAALRNERPDKTALASVELLPVALAEAKAGAEIPAASAEDEKADKREAQKREEQTDAEGSALAAEPLASLAAVPVPVVETPIVEASAAAVEGNSEIEIPVGHVEASTEGVAVVPAPTTVAMDARAIEPAAIELSDEQHSENQDSETAAVVAATVASGGPGQALAVAPTNNNNEEPTLAPAAMEQTQDEPAPSDAELVQALRLLTPASWSAMQSRGALETAGPLGAKQGAAEESTHQESSHQESSHQESPHLESTDHESSDRESPPGAAVSGRWVAVPVALSPEEAAMQLEAEMFRSFAAIPAVMAAPAVTGGFEAPRITGVSAIAAAVDNRLAAAALEGDAGAPVEPVGEQLAEDRVSEQRGSETLAAEPSTAQASPDVSETASNVESPVPTGPEAVSMEAEKIEAEKVEAPKIEAEQKVCLPKAAEYAPAEEAAVATFAEAVGEGEGATTPGENGEFVRETSVALTMATPKEDQDSSSDSGGQESMGKGPKSQAGQSELENPDATPAGVAGNGDPGIDMSSVAVIEAAKQAADGAEEALKARAAAAAAEGGAFPADATTIASIVESVLADLRPKLVEEIAKKLAKK
jgi:CheY-like chemotaxis protein